MFSLLNINWFHPIYDKRRGVIGLMEDVRDRRGVRVKEDIDNFLQNQF
jgi:hypothetical protein